MYSFQILQDVLPQILDTLDDGIARVVKTIALPSAQKIALGQNIAANLHKLLD